MKVLPHTLSPEIRAAYMTCCANFGINVKRIAAARFMTLKDVTRRTGYKPSWVEKWLSGTPGNEPTLINMLRFALVLNVPIARLLDTAPDTDKDLLKQPLATEKPAKEMTPRETFRDAAMRELAHDMGFAGPAGSGGMVSTAVRKAVRSAGVKSRNKP